MNTRSQTHANWHRLIEEYKKSGLKRSKFCKEKGIPISSFAYYLRTYNKCQSQQKPAFSQVVVQPQIMPPIAEIKIDLPNGIRCQVSSCIHPDQLKKLMGVLLVC